MVLDSEAMGSRDSLPPDAKHENAFYWKAYLNWKRDKLSLKEPGKSDLGETDWISFTELEVNSGKLLFLDPLHVNKPEEGLIVKLPRGVYSLLIREMQYTDRKRVSRLRVVLPDKDPEVGKLLGTTWTDIAMTGVCDCEAFAGLVDTVDIEELWDIRQPVFDIVDIDNFGTVTLEKNLEVKMPVVAAGFGDGEYPVHELLSRSARIGAEVEFIKPGTQYPF